MHGTSTVRLHQCNGFPEELLDVPATDLWQHLEGPSLFLIPGRKDQPIFVSVLLHGNEHSGWRAVQELMRRHQSVPLPRGLILFVGNVEAAKANVRTLAHQSDYNRVWPGAPSADSPEASVIREVFAIAKKCNPFAAIDVHNNTGYNPLYACVTQLSEQSLQLARLFSRTVVYFTRPKGVQTAALSTICPAVTVECGRSEEMTGEAHVLEFISSVLNLSQWPTHPLPDGDIDLLRTYAIMKISEPTNFSFDSSDADLRFRTDIDRLNFSELEAGTLFGHLGGRMDQRISLVPSGDFDQVDEYFDYSGGEIRLARSAIPAMLTRDPRAVRLDSLGYLMHRINRHGQHIST